MKKENWSIGKTGGCVITDTPDGLPENTGHSGTGANEYYGGALICESVWRKKDVALISAAPDMLEALIEAKEFILKIETTSGFNGDLYNKISNAIKKATE